MHRRLKTGRGIAAFLMGVLLTVAATSLADEINVGDRLPKLSLPDQHDTDTELDESRFVILAFDMGVAKSFNKWLDARGTDWLPEHDAVYVADISGMPTTIAKLFAVPKMRKYSHKILLNRDDDFAEKFPRKKDMVTILRTNRAGKITSISHLASPAVLETSLK